MIDLCYTFIVSWCPNRIHYIIIKLVKLCRWWQPRMCTRPASQKHVTSKALLVLPIGVVHTRLASPYSYRSISQVTHVRCHCALCRYTGSALFQRLSLSFGYLNKQGYCSRSNPSNCHRFPVMIGETGTNFESQADQQQMADFALYLNNQGAANDGQHNAIPSWFWWAWNANSGHY